jgi:hypothetical protein
MPLVKAGKIFSGERGPIAFRVSLHKNHPTYYSIFFPKEQPEISSPESQNQVGLQRPLRPDEILCESCEKPVPKTIQFRHMMMSMQQSLTWSGCTVDAQYGVLSMEQSKIQTLSWM